MIHQLTIRGTLHPVTCEDYSFVVHNDDFVIGGVFDGCSGGIESEFASGLIGKLIRKEANRFLQFNGLSSQVLPFTNEKVTTAIAKQLILDIQSPLKQAKELIGLGVEELLSTINLIVYNKLTNKASIIIYGDGCAIINGDFHQVDQNNQPDYIAYHLDVLYPTVYLERTSKVFEIDDVKDVSITSDGIKTFKNSIDDIDPIVYLCTNTELSKNIAMLPRKINILKFKHKLEPSDDLSIVRIINEEQ